MSQKIIKLTSFILLVCVLLSGCSVLDGLLATRLVRYDRMEYVRPDMDEFDAVLERSCASALEETDIKELETAILNFYDVYDDFYTNFSLAMIAHSRDLSDIYWEGEYVYCNAQSATADAGLDQLYRCLVKSPLRQTLEGEDYFGAGFFDDYDTDNRWTSAFTALLEEEARLESEYYRLTSELSNLRSGSDEYSDMAERMAQLLVDLINLRRDIASQWGYDSYMDYAWDVYYYRDYTPEQMERYMADIVRVLVPLYEQLADTDVWSYSGRYADEAQTFAFVRTAAMQMGGTVAEAFLLMESESLYDISYSPDKYPTSFEMYLTGYGVPFVYLCPEREVYDRLTFAHEFGHFCNDYASEGTSVGVDVLEVFSQGMEYLTLCYGLDTDALTRVKLADSLCVYVEQSAFAAFEHRAYAMPEEELSVDTLYDLYDRVATEYGFGSIGYDANEFITVSHFYTNPFYIDSYVVSNDAALQLYQKEQAQAGNGLKIFEESLATEEGYFLAFLEEAGLDSPFTPGRMETVKNTLSQVLQ